MSDTMQVTSGYENGSFRENPNPPGNNGWNNQRSSYQNKGGNNGGYRKFNKFSKPNEPPRDFNVDPPTLYKPYVGTGNTGAPDSVNQELKEVMGILEKNGYTVRTSAFDGLDKIFIESNNKELILPWRDFAEKQSKLTFTSEEAKFLARKYYNDPSKFDALKDTVKTFLAKNVRLLCGQNLKSPAQFFITWTEDGCENPKERSNGTGFAIHPITIAHELRMPIFNFGKPGTKERLLKHLQLETI